MSWRLLGLKGADRDNAFDCGFRGLFYTIFDVGVLIGAGVGTTFCGATIPVWVEARAKDGNRKYRRWGTCLSPLGKPKRLVLRAYMNGIACSGAVERCCLH